MKEYSLKYKDSDKLVFEGISFRIGNGDRVVLSGKNGSGKTTIIRKILQKCNPDITPVDIVEEGLCEVASDLIVSYDGK